MRLNSRVTAWFTADGARELQALEEDTGRYFHFTGSEGLPLDHFSIVLEGTRDEVAEEAVPFRGGEEVHVDIVEPHMYNPDDAVAKVDGYVITVTNGVAFVGEKKLVRIDEARRTTATAALTGADAEAAEEAAVERSKEREKAEQRAKRSAAAKKGAAKRKEREAASKTKPAAERHEGRAEAEAEAVEALTDTSDAGAGTGPAAAEDAGDDAPKPRRRRGGRGRSRARAGENGDAASADEAADSGPEEPAEDSENGDAVESKPRRRGRRGGRRRSRAKAGAEATEASKADE